jgi:hypothetical protein
LNAHGDIPIMTGDNLGETSDSTMTLDGYEEGFKEIIGNLSTAFFDAYPADDAASAGKKRSRVLSKGLGCECAITLQENGKTKS